MDLDNMPMDYSGRNNNSFMDSPESELKQWELKPSEELENLKNLLEGVPARDENDKILYNEDGQKLYIDLPRVNDKGARSIYNFVLEHSTKLVTLGYTLNDKYEDRVYQSKMGFIQSLFNNYEEWDLSFSDAILINTVVFTIIEMSYSRSINGNEKIYRAKTHQSVEHNIKQESSQSVNDSSSGSFLGKLLKRK